MNTPEWNLKDGLGSEAAYQFENINPKLVFLIALAAAFVAVACVYFAYVSLSIAIEAGLLPNPPRLRRLVE